MNKWLMKLLIAAALVCNFAYAAEPSLHEVYQAAEQGRFNDAQKMMHDVLQTHPNSAKAHFVEAELLAKQGQFNKARAELATAQNLAPGLPFAQPEAVQSLNALLSGNNASVHAVTAQPYQQPHQDSFPWGFLLIGVAIVLFVVALMKFMQQRNVQPGYGVQSVGGYAQRPVYGAQGAQPQTYGAGSGVPAGQPFGQPVQQGSGMGSSILGGLATGAAVGAGMVAGEALMHKIMDDHPSGSSHGYIPQDNVQPAVFDTSSDNMGGNDFGIADNSSWDDSSSGDSDWT